MLSLKDHRLPTGTMWHATDMRPAPGASRPSQAFLSPEYYRDHAAHRAPLWVVLPCGDAFCLDACPSGEQSHGWTVTGEAPNVTVSPSINCIHEPRDGGYHGWLQNGVLSDDCEGRVYS